MMEIDRSHVLISLEPGIGRQRDPVAEYDLFVSGAGLCSFKLKIRHVGRRSPGDAVFPTQHSRSEFGFCRKGSLQRQKSTGGRQQPVYNPALRWLPISSVIAQELRHVDGGHPKWRTKRYCRYPIIRCQGIADVERSLLTFLRCFCSRPHLKKRRWRVSPRRGLRSKVVIAPKASPSMRNISGFLRVLLEMVVPDLCRPRRGKSGRSPDNLQTASARWRRSRRQLPTTARHVNDIAFRGVAHPDRSASDA